MLQLSLLSAQLHSQGLAASGRGIALLPLLLLLVLTSLSLWEHSFSQHWTLKPASHYLGDLPAVCHGGSEAEVTE